MPGNPEVADLTDHIKSRLGLSRAVGRIVLYLVLVTAAPVLTVVLPEPVEAEEAGHDAPNPPHRAAMGMDMPGEVRSRAPVAGREVMAEGAEHQSIDGRHRLAQRLSNSFALLAFAILAMQFVLSARFRWVERPFGLDVLFRFHRVMAVVAATLLVIHPVSMAWGDANWALLTRLGVPWGVQAGRLALLLVAAIVITALGRRALRLGYESWRRWHNALALSVLALALAHSLALGGDVAGGPLRVLWVALAVIAVVAYMHHRVLLPRQLRAGAYQVVEVRSEAAGVWTLVMRPPAGAAAPAYLPGQFHFLTLHRPGLADEEHPFTIASSPTQAGSISSTIKATGDFTATIGQTEVGATVSVRGPYGRFSYLLHPPGAGLVFVGGGVGVTPLISMLRHLRDSGSTTPALLLYGCRTEADLLFRDELDAMAGDATGRVRVVYVLSEPGADWAGERGYLDRDQLARHLGDGAADRTYYVCGPLPMMKSVSDSLDVLGVPGRNIHTELFSL